jgi:hypothetical protein
VFSPSLSRQRRSRDALPTGLAGAKLAFPSGSTAACEHLLLRLPCPLKTNLDRQEGKPMTDQLFLAPATYFRNLRVRDLNLFVFVWRTFNSLVGLIEHFQQPRGLGDLERHEL